LKQPISNNSGEYQIHDAQLLITPRSRRVNRRRETGTTSDVIPGKAGIHYKNAAGFRTKLEMTGTWTTVKMVFLYLIESPFTFFFGAVSLADHLPE